MTKLNSKYRKMSYAELEKSDGFEAYKNILLNNGKYFELPL